MSDKAYATSTPKRTATAAVAPCPVLEDVSNAEVLRLLQNERTLMDTEVGGTKMVGELDWLQDWLSERPDPLRGVDVSSVTPPALPGAVVSKEGEWHGQGVDAHARGEAHLSTNPSATVSGAVSTGNENASAVANGAIQASREGASAQGEATGSMQYGGAQGSVTVRGSADSSGNRAGEVSGNLSHSGEVLPGLSHTASVQGNLQSDGTGSANAAGSMQYAGEQGSVTVRGSADSSGNRAGELNGRVSHSGEAASGLSHIVSAEGGVQTSAQGTTAAGTASGAVQYGGAQGSVTVRGSADSSGNRAGELNGRVSHSGEVVPGLSHTVSAEGGVQASSQGSAASGGVTGAVQYGGAQGSVTVRGATDSSGNRSGAVSGSLSHSGEVLPGLSHTASVQGNLQSDGTRSAAVSGQLTHTHELVPGLTHSTTTSGTLGTDGQRKGAISTGLTHQGETNGIEHSVSGGASINSDGQRDLHVAGRVGTRETHQEGDATVTTAAHLGGSAGLKKGLAGEVGMSRKSVSEDQIIDTSGSVSASREGAGLRLARKSTRENGRSQGELAVNANTDGSTTIRVGGDASAELWRKQAELAPGVKASGRALGGELGASAGFLADSEGNRSLNAEAKAALTLAEGTLSGERKIAEFGDFGAKVDGKLHAAAEARATAGGTIKLDEGLAVDAAVKAFVGVRAEAAAGTSLTWEREDDYGDMLRDFADNLPGTWDDALLDKLPDRFWTNVGHTLFGQGTAELLRVGVGVDARAGAGAEASFAGGVSEDGLFETDLSVGAALGVGGGARMRVGFNPIDTLRKGLVESIEAVNASFAYAEAMWRYVQDYYGQDTLSDEAIDLAVEAIPGARPDFTVLP